MLSDCKFAAGMATIRETTRVLILSACALAAADDGGCAEPTHNGTMFNQADIPGGHTTGCPSWQKCCSLCLANLACYAYSWDGNNCYLKSGPNDPHADTHTVSSIVREAAPTPPPTPPSPPPAPTPPPAAPQPAYANICNPASPTQRWDFDNGRQLVAHGSKTAAAPRGLCLTMGDYSRLSVYDCRADDGKPVAQQTQQWAYNTTGDIGTLVSIAGQRAGDVVDFDATLGHGMRLQLQQAPQDTTSFPSRHWNLTVTSAAAGAIFKSRQTDYWRPLCLDAAAAPAPRPCAPGSPAASQRWCDASLGANERVDDLLPRINESDWPGMFENKASGAARLVGGGSIEPYQWWSEALHGVGQSPGVDFSAPTAHATSFPQVIGTASSFNKTLFAHIGEAIGTEARAMANLQHAGLTFWTPNVNIFRDPRWGRGQETPGEDPTVNAAYASIFPAAMQGPDREHVRASACLKHHTAYSLEDSDGVTRHAFNAIVSAQELADTYLPAFQAGVTVGNASGLMCSYNEVNGVPMCGNKELLNDTVRGKWGFDGYITTDCGAMQDMYQFHNYSSGPAEALEQSLRAGLDTECTWGANIFKDQLATLLANGSVPRPLALGALRNLLRVRTRLGAFDAETASPYAALGAADIDTDAHRQLALEAARQSMVLLKNEGGVLPLRNGSIGSLAAVGPTKDGPMQGDYSGSASRVIGPCDGIKMFVANTSSEHGCDTASNDTSGIAAAVALAADADQTIIFVGLDGSQEGETKDRTFVHLPGMQQQLVDAVAAAVPTAKPAILVVVGGGAIDLTSAKTDPRIGAILWVGYPGQSGGVAIAETLFGYNNPSGRLTQTWYDQAYADKCSMLEMSMRPSARCPAGRSHRFFTGTPVFAFGDGLSYTTFEHALELEPAGEGEGKGEGAAVLVQERVLEKQLLASTARPHEAPVVATARVTVHNTGGVAGAHAVLLFVQPPHPGAAGAPLRSLAAFDRVWLEPGENRSVALPVTAHHFSFADDRGEPHTTCGDWRMFVDREPSAANGGAPAAIFRVVE